MNADSFQPKNENWYSTYNPLLTSLPRFNEPHEIMDELSFNPLSGININNLSIIDRDSLLSGEKTPLEPTTQSLRTAMTWWGMLITGLRSRNPANLASRRHYWSQVSASSLGMTNTFPATPTRGMTIHVVKGPTGTGKSVTAQRFCRIFTQQVINHGKDEAAGWINMQQLVYLEIMMSHDGTRGGFLLGILFQMDTVLGTTYANDLPKRFRTVEKLAVATIGRLIAHYTGILFVDEGQIRNLIESGQSGLMQMFLLLLMNSGIPLVMLGNEKAFDWVTYSQDMSRLYINPPEIFAPIGAIDQSEVNEWGSVATGVMGYYLLLKPIPNYDECSKILFRCSGGIARLALTLWCSTQRKNLLNSKEFIDPEDILDTYNSNSFDKLRPLADGFFYRKPDLLMTYPDVDAYYYAKHWGIPLTTSTSNQTSGHDESDSSKSKVTSNTKGKNRKTEKEKFATEQTKKQNKQKKREDLSSSLAPDDIRKQGLKNIHLAGFEAARTTALKKDG